MPAHTLTCPAEQRSSLELMQEGQGRGRPICRASREAPSSEPPSPEGGAGFQQDPKQGGCLGFIPSATTRAPHAGPSVRCQLPQVCGGWGCRGRGCRGQAWRGPRRRLAAAHVTNRRAPTTCSPRPRAEDCTAFPRLLNGPGGSLWCLWEPPWGRGASSWGGGPGARPAWDGPFYVGGPRVITRHPGWKRSGGFGGWSTGLPRGGSGVQ